MKLNLNATAGAGWCLAFVQSVFDAPVMHESAWKAWLATERKRNDPLPDAPVPVWFEHWGTYDTPARWDNFGHVVAYVPGKGFLSSPRSGHGSEWFDSIEAVEQAFNATYVGWSEDLNTKTIYEKRLTMSEYKKIMNRIDKAEKKIIDHISAQHRVTRGSSQLGWLRRRTGGAYSGESITAKLNRALGGIEKLTKMLEEKMK